MRTAYPTNSKSSTGSYPFIQSVSRGWLRRASGPGPLTGAGGVEVGLAGSIERGAVSFPNPRAFTTCKPEDLHPYRVGIRLQPALASAPPEWPGSCPPARSENLTG